MNVIFTEKQMLFQQKIRTFAKKHITPFISEMETKKSFPHHIVEKMRTEKLMGIPIAKEYGGAGMDFTSYVIAIHELSKVSAAVGVILAVHTSVGTKPILSFGTDEQKRKYAIPLAAGKYLGAFALTEPHAGSDAASITTSAVQEQNYYRLNGAKVFITNGGKADTYIVFATTNRAHRSKGITAFIVEKDYPGLQIGKRENKMGLHGSSTTEIILNDVQVPKENMLGKEGEGFKIAMAQLDTGRIGIAAQALGIAEAALEETLSYVKVRKRLHPSSSFALADMATKVEAAKLLTYRAAQLIDEGLPCSKEASMAKLFASKTAVEVSTAAVQLLGETGYTDRYEAERFFRDAKVCEIYEGTSEIQRIVISKHVLTK